MAIGHDPANLNLNDIRLVIEYDCKLRKGERCYVKFCALSLEMDVIMAIFLQKLKDRIAIPLSYIFRAFLVYIHADVFKTGNSIYSQTWKSILIHIYRTIDQLDELCLKTLERLIELSVI